MISRVQTGLVFRQNVERPALLNSLAIGHGGDAGVGAAEFGAAAAGVGVGGIAGAADIGPVRVAAVTDTGFAAAALAAVGIDGARSARIEAALRVIADAFEAGKALAAIVVRDGAGIAEDAAGLLGRLAFSHRRDAGAAATEFGPAAAGIGIGGIACATDLRAGGIVAVAAAILAATALAAIRVAGTRFAGIEAALRVVADPLEAGVALAATMLRHHFAGIAGSFAGRFHGAATADLSIDANAGTAGEIRGGAAGELIATAWIFGAGDARATGAGSAIQDHGTAGNVGVARQEIGGVVRDPPLFELLRLG